MRSRRLLLFGLALAAVMVIQTRAGAGRIETGQYSDDAAHLMNGLVLRDYLLEGFGTDPMKFAEHYYLNYPKIAPLMWPPLFHVALGIAFLAGGPPGVTALLILGLCCAWLVVRLFQTMERLVGSFGAVVTCAAFLTTPLVVAMTSVVMADIVVAVLALEAAWALAKFMKSAATRDAVIFGVFAAMACLTKGTGIAVLLLPVLLIPITGRWELLRRPGLYIAAAIVLFGAGPLVFISAMKDAAIGDFGTVTPGLVVERCVFFGRQLLRNLGPIVPALALAGTIVTLRGARKRATGHLPVAEAFVALAWAVTVFQLFNPHLASSTRYLTPAIAPLLALAMIGLAAIVEYRRLDGGRIALGVLGVCVLAGTVLIRTSSPTLLPLGYRDLVSHLMASNDLADKRLLVVSDEAGEGAAVTEIATRGLRPHPTVIRGSKLLSDADWMSNGRPTFSSAAAVMKEIEDLHVDYLLLDRSPSSVGLPYYSQAAELVSTFAARFTPIDAGLGPAAVGARPLALYRLHTRSTGAAKPLRLNMPHTLGRMLER